VRWRGERVSWDVVIHLTARVYANLVCVPLPSEPVNRCSTLVRIPGMIKNKPTS
jgi:hypothetical protein